MVLIGHMTRWYTVDCFLAWELIMILFQIFVPTVYFYNNNNNNNKFYFAKEGTETGTWVTTVQITWAKINQIKLREPLEIQTIHPKKYLTQTNDLGYDGHMLPINFKVIHHTLTYWEIILAMIIPKQITYSPTRLSLETDDKHRYWQWQKQYCWGRLLLCSSGCKQICGTQHWYGQLS